MTIGNIKDGDSQKLEKCLPVEGVWKDIFSFVLTVSIFANLLAAAAATMFMDGTAAAYAGCLKWSYAGTLLGALTARRHHLMDWFDRVWKRNVVGYSLCVHKDGDSFKHTILYNSELRALRRQGKQSEAPTCLLVRLNGGKDWFGAWKVSFAGMDWKDPMIFLTWGPDRIKVTPEWALLNYSHSGTISMVVSGMENLRREIQQEQKWRYQGEERQTELRMKLETANKESKELRQRLKDSHFLHLSVLAQLKDTSRLGKSKEGAAIRRAYTRSLKQHIQEGDEMYPALMLECGKAVEPPTGTQ